MDIMDPFTSELLSAPPPLGDGEFDDDYLRAIGALPRRPSRAASYVDYPDTLEPSSRVLPAASRELLAAAHVIPMEMQRGQKRAAPQAAWHDISTKRPRPSDDAEIGSNLREMETRQRPTPDYLTAVQGDRMDERARADLVAWMGGLARRHGLAPAVLHRAVSYVDRVLSARPLGGGDYYEQNLRLLGGAAVFTAAKYEDRGATSSLSATDIAGCCGFAATVKDVTGMDRGMLAALRYELGEPTAYTFVRCFTRDVASEAEVRRLAHQLADASLLEYECLQFKPSAVAASAVFLAQLMLDPAASCQLQNKEDFEKLTGYKPVDLVDGIYSLFRTSLEAFF